MTEFVAEYDRTPVARSIKLESALVQIFTNPTGSSFTDLHIEQDNPIMARVGSNDWVPALDYAEQPILVTERMINAFLNDIYKGDADVKPGDTQPWSSQLRKDFSLHPAMNIEMIDDAGKNKTVRVRMTVIRHQIGTRIGLMCRALREVPVSVEKIGLPVQVSKMAMANSGMILVTGPTGAGKTTSIAAMLNEINESRSANIITIEDPVEFVHLRKKSIINHRELGVDVGSFEAGVKDALRFVPDVIMLGEIRDAETMRAAVRAAESGHLVLASMHAPSTFNAIRKCLGYLNSPAEAMSFASSLVGVVTQALLVGAKGEKYLAYETLDAKEVRSAQNATLQSAIMQSVLEQSSTKLQALEESLRSGQLAPSVPMIQTLRNFVSSGKVTAAKAVVAAHHPEDVKTLLDMR